MFPHPRSSSLKLPHITMYAAPNDITSTEDFRLLPFTANLYGCVKNGFYYKAIPHKDYCHVIKIPVDIAATTQEALDYYSKKFLKEFPDPRENLDFSSLPYISDSPIRASFVDQERIFNDEDFKILTEYGSEYFGSLLVKPNNVVYLSRNHSLALSLHMPSTIIKPCSISIEQYIDFIHSIY